MKVLLLGDISGTRDGQDWPPRGTIVDLPADEAIALCNRKMARPAEDTVIEMGVEKAVTPAIDVEVRSEPLTTKTGPGRRTRQDA